MIKFFEYLGVILIASGLLSLGITAKNPAYWYLIIGIALFVKFGGRKND